MKRDYYITCEGILKREHNTAYIVNKEGKVTLPINKIRSIYAYGGLTISSAVILLIAKKGIPIHIFNHYGVYEATVYPKDVIVSGELLVKQVEHYSNYEKRLMLAREFVAGGTDNMLINAKNYSDNYDIGREIGRIEALRTKVDAQTTVASIMQVEGSIREKYYRLLDKIIPESFRIGKRTKRPPKNRGNALISFGNSLSYSTIITEIYNTRLNQTISYLHEPLEGRFSLSLDISEIFKPILVDRVILKLVNKKIIKEDDFEAVGNGVLLTGDGKKRFIKEYDDKLMTTIKLRGFDRAVSYRGLIRHELHKLEDHLSEHKTYRALRMQW